MTPKTLAKKIQNDCCFRNDVRNSMRDMPDYAFSYLRLCYDYKEQYKTLNQSEKEEFMNEFQKVVQKLMKHCIDGMTTFARLKYQITGEWNRKLIDMSV